MTHKKLVAALTGLAATAATAAIPPRYAENLPEPRKAGPVTYITGGTEMGEANAIKRAAQEFPLELVFVEKVGRREKHLANMPVRITDDKGKVVFEGESTGPYFLARLPKGKYIVSTRWDAWSFSREVKIGSQRQRVVFAWSQPGPMESVG
ncbi:MAG TPA: hypothetical protein VFE23_05075 [Usitatibacter sp.]|jgi:hypothetical protein|nr:hypothetical protein [Usitatibacter sp.]